MPAPKTQLAAKGKNDPMQRMRYADALAEKGRNAAALKEYLWCLDEGNQNMQGFYGVRLSFLLSNIIRLGQQYPPALAALKQRRDTCSRRTASAVPPPQTSRRILPPTTKTSADRPILWPYTTELEAKQSLAVTSLYRSISPLLLEQKRYTDLIQGGGNYAAQLDMEIATFKMMSGNAQMKLDKETKNILMRQSVNTGGGFYEALLGTDKTAEADALRDKLLAFDASAATYAELMRHAVRANKPEVAQKLKESAKSALSAADFAQLEKAAPGT